MLPICVVNQSRKGCFMFVEGDDCWKSFFQEDCNFLHRQFKPKGFRDHFRPIQGRNDGFACCFMTAELPRSLKATARIAEASSTNLLMQRSVLPVLTGDHKWATIPFEVRVQMFR